MDMLFSTYFRLWIPVLVLLLIAGTTFAGVWAASLLLVGPAWLVWCMAR